jgi:hypothetical protein
MAFQTCKFHDFRGQRLSLRDISRVTGINRSTLQKRVKRGASLDSPLYLPAPKPKKPVLTGNRDRDVEMIVRWMHKRLARSRKGCQ